MSGDFLGINLRDFVIGMQGGFAGVFLLPKPKARDVFAHGLVGGLAGNYGGPWLAFKFETPHDLTCCLVGACGMALLHLFISWVEYKAKRLRDD